MHTELSKCCLLHLTLLQSHLLINSLKVMVQFVLIYAAFYGDNQQKDLDQLLFGESTKSKLWYFFGLTTSIVSVCFSCTMLLKWGASPVIQSVLSFKFVKILFFILTKFLVQAYILSMALKSLMFYEVFIYHADTNSLEFKVFNSNFHGICNDR